MTDMNETTEVIMKTDRRGRLRYTAQQKQGKRSTEPLSHFCHRSGISGKYVQ
jgi:hypothetical protein